MLTTPLIGVLMLACSGEPTRSVCDAACDLAVECHSAERDIDAEATRSECLEATKATNDSCAKAEDGKLDPATKKVNTECVEALDQQAAEGECDAYTGTYEVGEVPEPPTPPAACGTYTDTLEAAQEATEETGPELCQRYTETFCSRTEECVIEDVFGGNPIPQDVLDAVGFDPYELCVDKLGAQTEACEDGLYDPSESATDPNTAREGARTCLAGFSELTCQQITSGTMPEECAGSFTSTEQSLDFALALLEVAQEFEDAAQ